MPDSLPRGAYRAVERECRNCGKRLVLKNNRDIERKLYCSLSCRQRFKIARGLWTPPIALMHERAHTPEANARKSHHGASHPKWIADRALLKKRPLHEGRPWMRRVYERDDHTCQCCGQRGGRLVAHHILSYRDYPQYRWEVWNGLTLCVDCHKYTANYGGKSHANSQ